MWERFSNLASVVAGQDDEPAFSGPSAAGQVEKGDDPSDLQIKMMEQERLIIQLKEMIRDRDKTLTDKDNELKKLSAEYSKHRLKSKSKIASLTSHLDQSQKSMSESMESASVCSDESTSTLNSEASSVFVEQTSRARLLVLKRKLKEKDQRLAEKDAIIRVKLQELEAKERIMAEQESANKDVAVQLTEQTNLVEHLRCLIRETTDGAEMTTKKQLESRLEEMISQMVYKDSMIMDLSNDITEKDKSIIDLREHIAEKDEVLRGRDQAIQVLKSMGDHEVATRAEGQVKEVGEKLLSAEKEIEQLKVELQKKEEAVVTDAQTMAEVMKVMEKKLVDTSDLVSAKAKQSEQLRMEIEERDKVLLETRQKLAETLKDLESLRRSFVDEEEKWKTEGLRLVEKEKDYEEEKRQRECAVLALHQLEVSYNSFTAEFRVLQENHAAAVKALEVAEKEREMKSVKTEEELSLRDKQIEELKGKLDQAATLPDSKFVKFKALAGSKIKALEKEVEELKQNACLAEELTSLRNHVAELEEEKGNLQLQLLEIEEATLKQASETEVFQLRKELDDLHMSYDGLRQANKSLESTVTELQASIKEIKREETEHSFATNSMMEEAAAELRRELEEAKKTIEAKDAECLSRDLKLEEILVQEEQLAEAMDSLKKKHGAEIEDINQQNALLSSSLEKEIEDRNQRLQKLESDNLTISNLLTAEEQKVLDQTKSLKEKDVEIQHLDETVQTVSELLSRYEDKGQELDTQAQILLERDIEIRKLNETVTDALEQLSVCRQKEHDLLAEAKTSVDKSSQFQYLKDEVRILSEKLIYYERKEQELVSLEEIALDREREIHRLTQMIASTSERLSNYEQRVDELVLIEKRMQTESESLKQSLFNKDQKILDLVTERDSSFDEIELLKSKVELGEENEERMKVKLVQLELQVAESNLTASTLETNFREQDNELENVLVKLKSTEELLERSRVEKEALHLEIDRKTEEMKRALMELEDAQICRKQADERLGFLERSLLEKDEEVQKATSDDERFQLEIESLTSRLRESEDLVRTLERKVTDNERKVESLAQNLEEEEMQLVSVTEELERLKIQLTTEKAMVEEMHQQLLQKNEAVQHLSEAIQEKELQAKKYLTLIKKLKQKLVSEEMLQRQSESFSSELQSCKDEMEEKQVELTKVQESRDEVQRQLSETVEELDRLRPVSEELKEMTVRWNNLAEEVRVCHLDKECMEREMATIKLTIDQKESVLSSIQAEVQAHCEEEILSRVATIQEERQQFRFEISEQKRLIENAETELAHTSGQREELSQKILYLERDLSVKSKELLALGSSKEGLSLTLSQLQLEKQNLVEELKTYQETLSAKDASIVSLNAELEHMQSEVCKNISCTDLSSAEVESLRKQNSLLSETVSKLKEENCNYTAAVEQLKAENFDLIGKLETLGEEAKKLHSEFQSSAGSGEVAELKSQLIDREEQNEELNCRLESITAEKQTLIAENLSQKNALELMAAESEKEKSHVADLDVELDAVCHRLQMLMTEKEDMTRDFEATRSALASVMEEYSQLSTKNSQLELSVDQMTINGQKSMDENCKLKLSCDNLAARLEEVEVEKSEVASQLSRLTSRSLETESLIREKESQNEAIREMQWEIESLRGNAQTEFIPQENFTKLEELKCQYSDLDEKCKAFCMKLEAAEAENEALRRKVTECNDGRERAESRAKDFEVKLDSSAKAAEGLCSRLEDEKMSLKVEAGRLKERAANAEAAVQQLRMDMEMERQHFATVENELQGSVEELELQVARLMQKVEILEEQNEKRATEEELKVSELSTHLQTCLEEKRQLELIIELERKNWNQQEERFACDLEQSRAERVQLEEEIQRKMRESQGQYDMLADDISHYQDLVDQMKAKNCALEQRVQDVNALLAQEKLNLVKEAEQAAKEKRMMGQELDEQNALRTENSSLVEEMERLSRQVQAFTEAEDNLEETQSQLFSLQSKNDALLQELEDHKNQLEHFSAMEAEQAALSERYEKLLQDNNALIHQSEEMYTQIRSYKSEEMEFLSLKERHERLQSEQSAVCEEANFLRSDLRRFEAENKGLRDALLGEKQEKRKDQTKAEGYRAAAAVQLREEVLVTKATAAGHERQQLQQATPTELDDDTPRIHVPVTTLVHSDIKRSLSEREMECGLLTTQVTELSTLRDQLLSHLQHREHELTSVHQQFQVLYQQYAILQQHYAAAVAEQKTVPDSVASTASIATAGAGAVDNRTVVMRGPGSQSCDDQEMQSSAYFALSNRLEDSERLCKEMTEENSHLEQHLDSEREKRLRLEEMLGQVQEQLKLQELSSQDSHSITMVEPEEERKIFRTKTSAAPLHLSRIQCPNVQRWFDGCSILLGRVLRGQPQVRKALLLYIAALHVYVIFGCLLSML